MPGFDRTDLPPADLEFVLLADTHYMLPATEVEFSSRRRQTDRVERALRRINALDPAFVVHLGDLVQEFPGSTAFDRAFVAATLQLDQLEPPVHYLPGNHDVGDKTDPTMPSPPVSGAALEAFHERVGPLWWTIERDGIRLVGCNTQLMNTDLPAAEDQRAFLETTLRDGGEQPTYLCCHLPPFLDRPEEAALGHYDTIGQPARDWLVDLVRDSPVTHVFASHTHFEFRHRLDDVTFHVCPSPSFTRPGFGELYASPPAPERGRDDRPKLGFLLVRVRDNDPRCHFVPTRERAETEAATQLTRTTAEIDWTPLGISVLGPFARTTAMPATFPASRPEPIHDDYPLIHALRFGAGHLRTPLEEFDRGRAVENYRQFRDRGGTVIGWILANGFDIDDALTVPERPIDELELRIAGEPRPMVGIEATLESVDRPVVLSTVQPGRSIWGKQHDRLRTGFEPEGIRDLEAALAVRDAGITRAVCRASTDPWARITRARPDLERIDALDWLVSTTALDEAAALRRACLAVLAVATTDRDRVSIEPFCALDRTMDVAPGLLTRNRNPTAVYRALQTLSTYCRGGPWRPVGQRESTAGRVVPLTTEERGLLVALPIDGATVEVDLEGMWPADVAGPQRRIALDTGTVTDVADCDTTTTAIPTAFVGAAE